MSDQNKHSDEHILHSWHANVTAWSQAVRDDRIESRRLVTNRAIIETVLRVAPRSVLDLGCGEGWLARTLSAAGLAVTGVDAVPALIEKARDAGAGDYRVVTYEAIAAGHFIQQYDAVVCNFALIGKESVEGLFSAMPSLLKEAGHFIVQTLHPVSACGMQAYEDGWRDGSWIGCGEGFSDPAPWYFRTLESWRALFETSGLQLREMHEPLHPSTGKPASVIFVAQLQKPMPAAVRR